MNETLELISKIGIVPVIALDDAKDAAPLAKALCDGGLPVAEVTFRTAAAEESIRIMAEQFPDMLVGAGTVLTTEQVDRAVAAGAKFIVSPGLNPDIVRYCVEKGITITPGCANPSDIEQALSCGLEVVKFFPAEAAGGIKMIKAMSAPYTKVKFMPTGGINADNLTNYLDFNKIIACGGSWMVNKAMIEAGDFEGITALTRQAVSSMLGFEIRHVGINMNSASETKELADSLSNMFCLAQKDGNKSVFVGDAFEIMKTPYLGSMGHIAIATNYLTRAMYHMERKGYTFNMDTASYDTKGNIKVVYMNGEFGGFALHLVQKGV